MNDRDMVLGMRWSMAFCVNPDEKVEGPEPSHPDPQRDNRGITRKDNAKPEGEG